MTKKTLGIIAVSIIVIAIAIITIIIKNESAISPALDGMVPTSLTSTTTGKMEDGNTASDYATPIKPTTLSYTAPEKNPQNTATPPAKDYVATTFFSNYKAKTTAVDFPISNSSSWIKMGYNAVLFVAKTEESCHENNNQESIYKNANGISFKVYKNSDAAMSHQYFLKTYQVTVGSTCYDFGTIEGFTALEVMDLTKEQVASYDIERKKESARVNTLLLQLVNSAK